MLLICEVNTKRIRSLHFVWWLIPHSNQSAWHHANSQYQSVTIYLLFLPCMIFYLNGREQTRLLSLKQSWHLHLTCLISVCKLHFHWNTHSSLISAHFLQIKNRLNFCLVKEEREEGGCWSMIDWERISSLLHYFFDTTQQWSICPAYLYLLKHTLTPYPQ